MTSLLRDRAELPQVVRAGGRSLRVTRWPGRDDVARVGPVPGEPAPTEGLIRAAVEELGERGFAEVLTVALFPRDLPPFAAAGLVERDRLVLLRSSTDALEPPRRRTRLARRREWADLAELDQRAFPAPWGLDRAGIVDAVDATPWSQVRALGRPAAGYAVIGLATRRGYLQRLAVDPQRQGDGVGRDLVLDALGRLGAHGAHEVLVNTQDSNRRALGLYEGLGFLALPEGLVVLGRTLGRPA